MNADQRYLIVIPAYNEASRIGSVLADIFATYPQADILVVDDGSDDHTVQVSRDAGAVVISHPFNLGYSCALHTGYKYALSNDYEWLVQFDADGQHIAAEIGKLIEQQNHTGADIVIGSRYMPGSVYPRSAFRHLGSLLFSGIIKLSQGIRITDPTSGFQLLGRRAIRRYARLEGFPEYPDANLLIDILKRGYHIVETPVQMKRRIGGVSMHSGLIKPISYLAVVLYSILLILIKRKGLY